MGDGLGNVGTDPYPEGEGNKDGDLCHNGEAELFVRNLA